MSNRVLAHLFLLASLVPAAAPAQRPTLGAGVRAFVAIDTSVIVIRNVRVIDGTGGAPRDNQDVVVRDGKIVSAGPGQQQIPPFAPLEGRPSVRDDKPVVIDGTGKTLLPGYVLVHEHMFYPAQGPVPFYDEMAFTFPRLYLAAGITTARTGGSMHPLADITLRKWIDSGRIPGPKLDITGPYLSGANGAPLMQFRELRDSADARRVVAHWADVGATSFKAYMWITRDELRAATDEAHKRGLKITGHLCSVTFREAAEIGIDNLEHGITAATDFVSGKQPDVCPSTSSSSAIAKIDPATDTTLASVIQTLVRHKVAVTSTLAIFETFTPGRGAVMMQQRLLDAMSPAERTRYTTRRAAIDTSTTSTWTQALRSEMTFEKKFADAGGLLLAGTDPTGYGGVIAGFGSQRTIELLVEAGFTPVQAIQIATQNGARYLGRDSRVGTIAAGKDADLILIDGNPAANIRDIEKVVYVFKDGVAYDSAKLI
ncbi:MAG TPA: amidohydrolase family protein, partial [Gemmatimonadaceae bacterium]|nr:amidohydrolase family protein [Gemmatimonadaceae bacterium]